MEFSFWQFLVGHVKKFFTVFSCNCRKNDWWLGNLLGNKYIKISIILKVISYITFTLIFFFFESLRYFNLYSYYSNIFHICIHLYIKNSKKKKKKLWKKSVQNNFISNFTGKLDHIGFHAPCDIFWSDSDFFLLNNLCIYFRTTVKGLHHHLISFQKINLYVHSELNPAL